MNDFQLPTKLLHLFKTPVLPCLGETQLRDLSQILQI